MSSYLINELIAQSLWLFWLIYLSSFLFMLSNDDWFLVWIGLELNILRFISIIFRKKVLNIERCMRYFFVQSVGSGVLICGFYGGVKLTEVLGVMVLRYKIGAGPFYFWFPVICRRLSWFCFGILASLQRVIPLILIRIFLNSFLILVGFIRLVIGVLGSFNQTNLRKLIAYSSVHHVGWIVICIFLGAGKWFIYLFIYFFIILGIFYFMWLKETLVICSINKIKIKWGCVLGMLNIGGIPPILGFFLKWWVFKEISIVRRGIMFFIIIISVIMFYVYFRVSYGILLDSSIEVGWDVKGRVVKLVRIDGVYLIGIFFSPILILLLY